MYTLYVISLLLVLVALVAFIWLVVLAFQKRIWWGVGVLFLSPMTATMYAIKYWKEVKRPFLVYVTTFVFGAALGLYVYTAWDEWRVERAARRIQEGVEQGTLREEDVKEFMHSNLDLLENRAESEHDRQQVAVMKKFFQQAESGFTEEQQTEISQDVLMLLEQSDVSEKERRQLAWMRGRMKQPEAEAGPATSNMPPTVARTPEEAAALENREWRSRPIPAPDPESKGPRVKVISPADAKDYIGAPVILTGSNGFDRSAGKISFEYKAGDIKSLKVLLD